MSTQYFNVRLRRRRASLEEITVENPTPLYGEMIFVSGVDGFSSDRLKIGNGQDSFAELPWFEDETKVDREAIGQPNGLVPLNSKGVVADTWIPSNFNKRIDPPTVESVVYTGEQQSPPVLVDALHGQILTGNMSAIEVGDYMIAAKPAPGFTWSNGNTDTIFLPWSIERSNE